MSSSIRQFGSAILLVFFAFSIYAHLLRNDFINYDDQGYIYNNPQVTRGLGASGIKWAFSSTIQSNWHPLSWMSHMLDVSLFGLWPGGHHLSSLLLHLLNTLLVLWIFYRMTGDFWPSFLLAALFAVHPMHIESVAWASEKKDVLSTFFFLLTILAYHVYTRHRRPWRMMIVTVVFALGLMAKPMLVSLPFVLLLLDYWPLARFNPPDSGRGDEGLRGWHFRGLPPAHLWMEKIPLFALSGISCLITMIVQTDSLARIQSIPPADRLLNALTGYGLYLLKAVWPIHLSVFYPLAKHPSVWASLLSGLIVLVITALVLLKRSPRYLLVGWFFFLGTLIPVIGLVQVGNQIIADRYTYIPYLGLFIMVVYAGAEIQRRAPYATRPAMLALAGFVLVAFGYLTSRHVPRWKNSQTLFSYIISIMPDNSEALFHLADDAIAKKAYSSAISFYLEGLARSPSDPKALNNLGTAYLFTHNLQNALKCYDAALRLNPGYELASRNRAFVLQMLTADPNKAGTDGGS